MTLFLTTYNMKLSITAILSEEEVFILAKEKWWNEKISVIANTVIEEWKLPVVTYEEIPNPQTAESFVVNVYQSMIVNDASIIFTREKTKQLQEQIAIAEKDIKDKVTNAITWSIDDL